MNVSAATTLEPGDFILIDGYPSPWGYHRVVLGVQPSGAGALEGFVSRNSCQYTLVGYYQQLDFVFDGEPVLLEYTGNSSINVLLQWWLDYSAVQSQCEEPSVSASELTTYLDSTYQAYSDLGPLGSTSSFESSNEMLKITEYPSWNHNTLVVQIESNDGKPLDGFVYVGKETLKISGNSVAIPLSRRSFLPATFQISFPTIRKFTVRWWANHLNAQDIPVQMTVSSNQGQDSIYCEYSFPGTRERNVSLGYSANDFADGNAPAYTAKSTLEDAALGLVANSFYVGTVYDIQANISNGKTITLALPLETISNVDRENLLVYHESNGVIETIVPDSIAGGFVYFRTSSCSKFWTAVGNFFTDIGWTVLTSVISLGPTAVTGVQLIVDRLYDSYNWLVNGICNVFDPDVWASLTERDLDGISVESWDLPEGKMPGIRFKKYNSSLFRDIKLKASSPLHQINNNISNIEKLDSTKYNLDIMLSELISRKMDTTATKRFEIADSYTIVEGDDSTYITNYFATSTPLTKYAFDMAQLLNDCYGAINLNTFTTVYRELYKLFTGHSSGEQMCRDILGCFGVVEYAFNIADCTTDMLDFITQIAIEDGEYTSAFTSNRDELILGTSDVLARVALLAYYDKSMRESLMKWFNQSYKSLSVIMDVMGPLMRYNNISIKAEAAMALYEYVYWGKTTHLEKLKKGIELHYGENGGYSEGTGYLQYINEDVPYLMVALKKAHAQKGKELKLPQKFYNSGYYLMDMSRNVLWNKAEGFKLRIPIEIDDGCTYTPEYSVWGTLTGDDMFFKMANEYSMHDAIIRPPTMEPLIALGYTDWKESYSDSLENVYGVTGRVADGGAIICYRDKNGEDYSITLVAENEDMWENGQAHDQQDNMSFTLSSTRDGTIVYDMGYSDFGNDENTRGYENHNVLMRPNHPELTDGTGNQPLTLADWKNRAEAYTGDYTGLGTQLFFELTTKDFTKYGITKSGGSEASLVDSLRIDSVWAYTFYQKTKGGAEQIPSFENFRSIAYFGETLWLFDQPSDNNLLWVVNGSNQESGSSGSYFDEMADVYIGTQLANDCSMCDTVSAIQHVSRLDYPNSTIVVCRQTIELENYRIENQGDTIFPVTMIYHIDRNSSFGIMEECSSSNVQCFERTKGNIKQRVIVPAKGTSYKLGNVLEDIPPSNLSTYNGIMFAERKGNDGWDVIGILNDGEKTSKFFIDTRYLPSNFLLRAF